MTRLYEVTFNKYINDSHDAVRHKEADAYINTSEPVIIKEEDIPYMKNWGEGINTLKYVGVLSFESDEEEGEQE